MDGHPYYNYRTFTFHLLYGLHLALLISLALSLWNKPQLTSPPVQQPTSISKPAPRSTSHCVQNTSCVDPLAPAYRIGTKMVEDVVEYEAEMVDLVVRGEGWVGA
jgi:hypothetical protein